MTGADSIDATLPLGRVVRTWWPLAASWLFMAAELPMVTAAMARLPQPAINLAAYGGIVFPIALIIESPIIMLLAASTALSQDWASYVKLRRFMNAAGASLTALHAAVAFTPLYYVVTVRLIGAPPEILAPARIGLILMLPWTWSIAYRRFHQGVLIRCEHSKAVGLGTFLRLATVASVLLAGGLSGRLSGIEVATLAVSAGVISEAVYVGWRVRPVLREELRPLPPVEPALTYRAFLVFYLPLVMTSLLTLLAEPIGSAALSRMPLAIASLAVWPVISGLLFMLQSMGVALNEVVVALLDRRQSYFTLRRFVRWLAVVQTAIMLGVAATPLAGFWFGRVAALDPALAELAQNSLWLALPIPALSALQSWFQGVILHGRRTRAITEAVLVFLVTNAVILTAGVASTPSPGLYVGLAAYAAGSAAQALWLWWRSRPTMHTLATRDAPALAGAPAMVGGDSAPC